MGEAILEYDQCDLLCLVDKRSSEPFGYCSMLCDTECPPGWTCLPVEDPEDNLQACVANAAVCGNGIVEFGEACDDNNTVDGDTCSADCSRVTLPSTSGRVTLTVGNGGATTFDGEQEGGFAWLRNDGALIWNYTTSLENIAFEMPRFDQRTSAEGTQLVEFYLNPFPCNFNGITSATITAFDAAERRVAGNFSLSVTCWANCSSCGGEGSSRAISVDFDFVWLERPDL
jgi:cysteine-rich repeat protein